MFRNNIVDKIIYMLEEHSLNLEKLVEKRTEQWIEEKKRTEELLHSMLPKYWWVFHYSHAFSVLDSFDPILGKLYDIFAPSC